MCRKILSISFLAIIFLVVLMCGACDKKKKNSKESTVVQQPKQFSIGNYNFAILENTKFIPYNKAIYHRGDEVYMVLENVGPFKKDRDSLNHADMKLIVTNAIGEIISARLNLFGSRGEKNFENNILKSPYASYTSDQNDKPGKYTMTITIYDLLKRDSLVVSDDFFLE